MLTSQSRLFAVIPAAGHSRRMGRPKLLLPLGETTVIGRLLQTLSDADIEPFVLIRPGDDALLQQVARTSATIIQPDNPPPEMRISVEHLLRAIETRLAPAPDDGWLLVPADHPLLTRPTLDRLITTWREDRTSIIVPTHRGRRGHPTIFPWPLAAAVRTLPLDAGVNQLLHNNKEAVREVPVDDPTVTFDLDTPEDYARAIAAH